VQNSDTGDVAIQNSPEYLKCYNQVKYAESPVKFKHVECQKYTNKIPGINWD
jgi:hypothetical protein